MLALDVGDRRIGVAVSDPLGITAQGVEVIETKGWRKDLNRIQTLLTSYETDRVLVGLPLSMDGRQGEQAQKVMAFADYLVQGGLSVRYWDERLTTAAAHRSMIEGGARRDARKLRVDMVAAMNILQNFLDAGGWESRRGRRDGGGDVDGENMERDDIVELVDEDGKTIEFEHLMTIEHEGDAFVLLTPVVATEDLSDDEVLILRIEEDEKGEEYYATVDDDALTEVIFNKYLEIVEESGEEGEEE